MYYLTLDNGYRLEFYILSCAEIYRDCYGGTITYYEPMLLAA